MGRAEHIRGVLENFRDEDGGGGGACGRVVEEGLRVVERVGAVDRVGEVDEGGDAPGSVGGVVGLCVFEVPGDGGEDAVHPVGAVFAFGVAPEGVEGAEFALGPDFDGVVDVSSEEGGAGGLIGGGAEDEVGVEGVGVERPPEGRVGGRGFWWGYVTGRVEAPVEEEGGGRVEGPWVGREGGRRGGGGAQARGVVVEDFVPGGRGVGVHGCVR